MNRPSSGRVFLALLKRDAYVASRELPFFLLRTTMQPLLFVIVFGYVLPKMGFVARGYGAAMLPGILAISLAFASLQSVALPMVADFGWTREIEDRLLAPVPMELVALEKVLSGVAQGVIAALFVLPIARLIMGPIPGLDVRGLGSLLAITLLAAGTFSCFGLLMGTIINPAQIGLMFGFIVAPMIFFGCAYYPWQGLDAVPVMKYVVLINPLVYVSEGMRAVLTPSLPHMPIVAVASALLVLTGFFWIVGMRGFTKRAVG
ncbi:MAG TPA: ABC transporter permease [Gemmatimonadales bacterium]|nr:ABC transporter permease [Gemmatimonadales bacterium]